MLVLSRREMETVKFPGLGIEVTILKISDRKVKVGVQAPIEIKVLRGEAEGVNPPQVARSIYLANRDDHAIRNELNLLNIAIALAKKKLESHEIELAANILFNALSQLEQCQLEQMVCDQPVTVVNDGARFNRHNIDRERGIHALLVEDVDNERTMLTGFLELHGIRVDAVDNGVQALQFLENNSQPDFILMDMGLPQLDGASTVRSIRRSAAFDPIEIFAISGNTPESVGIDVGKNRIAHWFQKPLQPKTLVDTIHHMVGSVI